jgi:cytochrome c-type biogenesis protein
MLAITQHDLTAWWAPALAFAAGVVSFASPCVFPLVPGYVSFVTGGREAEESPLRKDLGPILLFIAGFSVVFTAAGVFSQTLVPIFKGTAGQWVAGGIVVVLGMLMLGYAVRRGGVRLYSERRPFLSRVRPGTVGALPLGMAFAAGWTPCIGPVLGGILGIAASSGSAFRGGALLLCYSAGLGVPFLLVGLGIRRLMGALGWVKRYYGWIAGVSGVAMIVVGILIATGAWTRLLAPLARRFTPSL